MQQRYVELAGMRVPYRLRKQRGTHRLTLSVRRDGTVTLTVPRYCTVRAALQYLNEKRTWLEQALRAVPAHERIDAGAARRHYSQHKERARALVHERLKELNQYYGYTWGRIAIRHNTSSWGSCSSKRNLNFDYRILFLPTHLQDYILVHELCHLVEMNHSVRFWELVAVCIPNHDTRRKELRSVRIDVSTALR